MPRSILKSKKRCYRNNLKRDSTKILDEIYDENNRNQGNVSGRNNNVIRTLQVLLLKIYGTNVILIKSMLLDNWYSTQLYKNPEYFTSNG